MAAPVSDGSDARAIFRGLPVASAAIIRNDRKTPRTRRRACGLAADATLPLWLDAIIPTMLPLDVEPTRAVHRAGRTGILRLNFCQGYAILANHKVLFLQWPTPPASGAKMPTQSLPATSLRTGDRSLLPSLASGGQLSDPHGVMADRAGDFRSRIALSPCSQGERRLSLCRGASPRCRRGPRSCLRRSSP